VGLGGGWTTIFKWMTKDALAFCSEYDVTDVESLASSMTVVFRI
jgi:hypothetical protein